MARKIYELVITTWPNGSCKNGMLTFNPGVAQRWKNLGKQVVEHLEGIGLGTPDVVAQIESVDDIVAHNAWIDTVEAGTFPKPIAQARAAVGLGLKAKKG